jgi:D-aminopeptidase
MSDRPRARDLGIVVGVLPPGPNNAITDVAGVKVGHATVRRGERVRTGVTAIVPHSGNLFREKVPGAVFVGNGFGKLVGSTQVNELGEIETPILLTSTLNTFRVADELINYMLTLDGNQDVRSINPLVGETNDGVLNDIQGRHSGHNEVSRGDSGSGGWCGCRRMRGRGHRNHRVRMEGRHRDVVAQGGAYTVGVLVQSNFGGRLTILGVPIERPQRASNEPPVTADGSIMMIVATDAPVDARNLSRMAARTMLGLGRTGAAGSNGSGDYAIAFSTVRGAAKLLSNDEVSALFPAVIEATEEAIYNSLFRAETTTGNGRTVEALPIESTVEMLRKRGVVK